MRHPAKHQRQELLHGSLEGGHLMTRSIQILGCQATHPPTSLSPRDFSPWMPKILSPQGPTQSLMRLRALLKVIVVALVGAPGRLCSAVSRHAHPGCCPLPKSGPMRMPVKTSSVSQKLRSGAQGAPSLLHVRQLRPFLQLQAVPHLRRHRRSLVLLPAHHQRLPTEYSRVDYGGYESLAPHGELLPVLPQRLRILPHRPSMFSSPASLLM